MSRINKVWSSNVFRLSPARIGRLWLPGLLLGLVAESVSDGRFYHRGGGGAGGGGDGVVAERRTPNREVLGFIRTDGTVMCP